MSGRLFSAWAHVAGTIKYIQQKRIPSDPASNSMLWWRWCGADIVAVLFVQFVLFSVGDLLLEETQLGILSMEKEGIWREGR